MKHGFLTAFGLIWAGAMAGAALSYCIALWLGRQKFVTRLKAVRRARDGLQALCWDGQLVWVAVLGLRLIPLVPFFALSLAAGVLRVSPADYFRGTAVGILPATLVLTLAGRGLISGNIWIVALTIVSLVIMAIMLWLGLKHHREHPALQPGGNLRIDGRNPKSGEVQE